MVKFLVTIVALAVVAQFVSAEPDHVHEEELILSHIDMRILAQIKRDTKDFPKRCELYNTELRRMFHGVVRETISQPALMMRTATVLRSRLGPAGANLAGEYEHCAEKMASGAAGGVDASYAPSKLSHSSVNAADEHVILSRLDFGALVEVEKELVKSGLGELERCSSLAEELREMLGNLSEGLSQTELFNRLICVLDRRAAHLKNFQQIWENLTRCLGRDLKEPTPDGECWQK